MKKTYRIKVQGQIYDVEVQELEGSEGGSATAIQEPVATAGKHNTPVAEKQRPPESPSASSEPVKQSPGQEQVIAPMPGNILEVRVNQGDQVQEGDLLLLLEAMKMENEIKASRSGHVEQIMVQAGQAVNTGDVLLVLK